MNKLLWLCGIVAFTVVSCTEGNWGKVKEKDALGMYDSVLIGRDPGFSRHLTEDYWMLYKNGTVTKCTRSVFASDDGKDTVRTVRFSDANGRRVQYLIDDIYVKGTAKDIVLLKITTIAVIWVDSTSVSIIRERLFNINMTGDRPE